MIGTNGKILIVDDEARIRSIFVRLCVESGLVARWASNAQESLNVLMREEVDLVLLDIFMPKLDGKAVFEIIREHDPLMKIIIASSYPLHVQKLMVPDANDYYDKCHGPSLLLAKIMTTIDPG